MFGEYRGEKLNRESFKREKFIDVQWELELEA